MSPDSLRRGAWTGTGTAPARIACTAGCFRACRSSRCKHKHTEREAFRVCKRWIQKLNLEARTLTDTCAHTHIHTHCGADSSASGNWWQEFNQGWWRDGMQKDSHDRKAARVWSSNKATPSLPPCKPHPRCTVHFPTCMSISSTQNVQVSVHMTCAGHACTGHVCTQPVMCTKAHDAHVQGTAPHTWQVYRCRMAMRMR